MDKTDVLTGRIVQRIIEGIHNKVKEDKVTITHGVANSHDLLRLMDNIWTYFPDASIALHRLDYGYKVKIKVNKSNTIDETVIDKPSRKLTPNEQLAIEYAKVCGCKWLTKDKNNEISAFANKPIKSTVLGVWDISDCDENIQIENEYVEINIPISFISWEDEEPYYIGD